MSEVGISIRMIRNYNPKDDRPVSLRDRVLFSCLVLGHTWRINVGEPRCNVCGAPNPDAEPEPGA